MFEAEKLFDLGGRVALVTGGEGYLGSVMSSTLAANGARKVRLEGHGLGAIPALFAALLSDKVNGLELTDAIESFEAEANNPASLLPLSCIPPGILKVTDIPEILSALRKAKMPVRIMHG